MGTLIVLIPRSGLNFPVDSLQTQKLLQIYNGVFAWLNKKHSGKGREITSFSKWGQKQMDTFLLLDHTGLCLTKVTAEISGNEVCFDHRNMLSCLQQLIGCQTCNKSELKLKF